MATNPRVDPVTDIIVPEPPRLVSAPDTWDPQFQDQYSNVLRLYFNRLTNLLRELNVANGETGIYPLGTAGDAFGRLRTSAPYTLFNSDNRFQKDHQFDESLSAGATSTYSLTDASVTLALDGTASESAVRQTYRVFPYQPGKSLLMFATFSMCAAIGGVETKVGYFDGTNGVYFRRSGSTLYFEILKNGSVNESVVQASWNGDKMDGTGASGVTLDLTKTQILYMDFEWLGVGTVRCGFVQDGKLYVCHSFHHANTTTSVYMTTATLPVRYEIEDSAGAGDPSSLQQICSTVMSEGGYDQKSAPIWARRTTLMAATTSFQPIVSIQIKSGSEGAVIIPSQFTALPVGSVLDYEVALIKNPTLTGASFTSNSLNVDYDVTATALTGGTIVSTTFISSSNQGSTTLDQGSQYNFDLQLGVDLSGTSDIYTLAARTLSGSDDIIGALSYYDLTY